MRMLSYNSDHFQVKQKIIEDQQQQLTGNTWPVLVMARLLAGLAIPHKYFAEKNITENFGRSGAALKNAFLSCEVRAGSLHLRSRLVGGTVASAAVSAIDPQKASTDEQLLLYLISRGVSHRGVDVKMDSGIPFCASDFARRSVDPTLCSWKVLMSYSWKQSGHINPLEAIAVLDLLKELGRSKDNHLQHILLMVDNTTVQAELRLLS